MADEKLQYELSVKFDQLIKGYEKLESVMASAKKSMKMDDVQLYINALVKDIQQAVTQVKNLMQAANFKTMGTNLSSLNSNVATLTDSITKHLSKITQQEEQINKASLKGLSKQLQDLSAGMERFGEIAKGSLAQAFKDEKMGPAVASLKQYVKVLDSLSKINIPDLGKALKGLTGDNINSVIGQLSQLDFDTLNGQLTKFINTLEGIDRVTRRVESLSQALLRTKEALANNEFKDVVKYFDDIARKAAQLQSALGSKDASIFEGTFSKPEMRQFANAMRQVSGLIGDYQDKIKNLKSGQISPVQNSQNFFMNMSKSIQVTMQLIDKLNNTLKDVANNMSRSFVLSFQMLNKNIDFEPLLKQLNLADDKTLEFLDEIRSFDFTDIQTQTKSAGQAGQKVIGAVKKQINDMVQQAQAGLKSIIDYLDSTRSNKTLPTNLKALKDAIDAIKSSGKPAATIIDKIGSINISKDQVSNIKEYADALKKIVNQVTSITTAANRINEMVSDASVKRADDYALKIKEINKSLRDGIGEGVINKNVVNIDMTSLNNMVDKLGQLKQTLRVNSDAMARMFGGSSAASIASNTKFKSYAVMLKDLVDALDKLSKGDKTAVSRLNEQIQALSGSLTSLGSSDSPIDVFKAKLDELSGSSRDISQMARLIKGLASNASSTKEVVTQTRTALNGNWPTQQGIGKVETVFDNIIAKSGNAKTAIDQLKQLVAQSDFSSIVDPLNSSSRSLTSIKNGVTFKWDTTNLDNFKAIIEGVDRATAQLVNNLTGVVEGIDAINPEKLKSVSAVIPSVSTAKKQDKTKTVTVPSPIKGKDLNIAKPVGEAQTAINTLNTAIANARSQFAKFTQEGGAFATTFQTIGAAAGRFDQIMIDTIGKLGAQGYTIGDLFTKMAQSVSTSTQSVSANINDNVQKPVNDVVQVTSASIDKLSKTFAGLSAASMKTANGFFNAFESSKDMKEFATNLKALAGIDASGLNNIISSVNKMIGDLQVNNTSGLSDLISSLTSSLKVSVTESDVKPIQQIAQALSGLKVGFDQNQFVRLTSSFNDITAALGRFADGLNQLNGQIATSFKGYADTVASAVSGIDTNLNKLSTNSTQSTTKLANDLNTVSQKVAQTRNMIETNAPTKPIVNIDKEQIDAVKKSLDDMSRSIQVMQNSLNNGVTGQGFGSAIGNIISNVNALKNNLYEVKTQFDGVLNVKLDTTQFNSIVQAMGRIEEALSHIRTTTRGVSEDAASALPSIQNIGAALAQSAQQGQQAIDQLQSVIVKFKTQTLERNDTGDMQLVMTGWDEAGRAIRQIWSQTGQVMRQQITNFVSESSDAERTVGGLVALIKQLTSNEQAQFTAEQSGYNTMLVLLQAAHAQIASQISDYGDLFSAQAEVTNALQAQAIARARIQDQTRQANASLETELSSISKTITQVTANGDITHTITGMNAAGEKITEIWDGAGRVIKRTTTTIETAAQESERSITNLSTLINRMTANEQSQFTAEQNGHRTLLAALQSEHELLERLIADYGDQFNAQTQITNALTKQEQVRARIADQRQRAASNAQARQQEQDIARLVRLYGQLASANKAMVSAQGTANEASTRQRVAQIQEQINQIEQLNQAYGRLPNVIEAAANAQRALSQAQNTADTKNAITALKEWQKLQKQAIGQDRTTEAFALLSQRIEQARQRYMGYSDEIRHSAEVQEVFRKGLEAIRQAAAQQNKNLGNLNASYYAQLPGMIDRAKTAQDNLTNAQRDYDAALKSGNAGSMQTAGQKLYAAQQQVEAIKNIVNLLPQESALRKQILSIIDQTNASQKASQTIGDKLLSQIVSMVRMYVGLQGIRRIWSSAKDFAMEYYDAINEIRLVTQISEAEADALSDKYMALAKVVGVTATEIAKAAVVFSRQNRTPDDVTYMLTQTTQFAKTAGIEFDQAAKLITAAVNGMGVSAQKAVDIFTYLGNKSASSASDVAQAMEKVSAVAGQYGVSIEWLGSYIATIVDKTQQAAESVGTALNTIIARLHSIKKNGYNSEDETTINDVAKALATVNIALMDSEGNWRDMEEIFQDIAAQWDTMSAKQRSYIATTIAGTRQQNYFLTLMEDMSKGVEGGSKAFALYEGAMSSAGTTAQAYEVYMDSITAAQDRMKTSMQNLYKSIFTDDFFKKLYDGVANVANAFAEFTRNADGLNITTIALAAGFLGVATAIKKVIDAVNKAGSIKSFMSANWITLIAGAIAVVGQLTATIIAQRKEYAKAQLGIKDYTSEISKAQTKITSLKTSINGASGDIKKLNTLLYKKGEGESWTTRQLAEVNRLLGDVKTSSEAYSTALKGIDTSDTVGQINAVTQALKDQNAEYIRAMQASANYTLNDETTLSGWAKQITSYQKEAQKYTGTSAYNNQTGKYSIGNQLFDSYEDFIQQINQWTTLFEYDPIIKKANGNTNNEYINRILNAKDYDYRDIESAMTQYYRIGGQNEYNYVNKANSIAGIDSGLNTLIKDTIAPYIFNSALSTLSEYNYTAQQEQQIMNMIVSNLFESMGNFDLSNDTGVAQWTKSVWSQVFSPDNGAFLSVFEGTSAQSNELGRAFAEYLSSTFDMSQYKSQLQQMVDDGMKTFDIDDVMGKAMELSGSNTHIMDAFMNNVLSGYEPGEDIKATWQADMVDALQDFYKQEFYNFDGLGTSLLQAGVDAGSAAKQLTDLYTVIKKFGETDAELSELTSTFFGADFDLTNWETLIAYVNQLIHDGGTIASEDYWNETFMTAKGNKSTKVTNMKTDTIDKFINGMNSDKWNLEQFVAQVNAAGSDIAAIESNLSLPEGFFQGIADGTITVAKAVQQLTMAKAALETGSDGSKDGFVQGFASVFGDASRDADIFINTAQAFLGNVREIKQARDDMAKGDYDAVRKLFSDQENKLLDDDELDARLSERQQKIISSQQYIVTMLQSIVPDQQNWDLEDILVLNEQTESQTVRNLIDLYLWIESITQSAEEAGSTMRTLFGTIDKADTTKAKAAFTESLQGFLDDSTVADLKMSWNDNKSELVSMYGQEFYDQIANELTNANPDTAKLKKAFEHQARLLNIMAAEQLTTPKVMTGVGDIYKTWILDNNASIFEAYSEVNNTAREYVKKNNLLKTMLDETATEELRNDAAKQLFGGDIENYAQVTQTQIAAMTTQLNQYKSIVFETARQISSIAGIDLMNVRQINEQASNNNPWAAWLQEIRQIYIEFGDAENPFKLMFDSYEADAKVTEWQLADYANQFIAQLTRPDGLQQFREYWSKAGTDAKQALIDNFNLGDDFYALLNSATTTAADIIQRFQTTALDSVLSYAAEGMGKRENDQIVADGFGDVFTSATKGADVFLKSVDGVITEMTKLANARKAFDQGDNKLAIGLFGYENDPGDAFIEKALSAAQDRKAEREEYLKSLITELYGQEITWEQQSITQILGAQDTSDVVRNLLTLYNWMHNITASAQEAAVGMRAVFTTIKDNAPTTTSGMQAINAQLISMMNVKNGESYTEEAQKAYDEFIRFVKSNDYSEVSSIIGPELYTAITEGQELAIDDVIQHMSDYSKYLGLERLETAGKILPGLADMYNNITMAEGASAEGAAQFASETMNTMKQLDAYTRLKANQYTNASDREADIATLGIDTSGKSQRQIDNEIRMAGVELSHQQALFDETINQLWSLLPDITAGDTNALDGLVNQGNALAIVLQQLIQYQAQLANTSDSAKIYNKVMNMDEFNQIDVLGDLSRLLSNSSGRTEFMNFFNNLGYSAKKEFLQAIGFNQKEVRDALNGGMTSAKFADTVSTYYGTAVSDMNTDGLVTGLSDMWAGAASDYGDWLAGADAAREYAVNLADAQRALTDIISGDTTNLQANKTMVRTFLGLTATFEDWNAAAIQMQTEQNKLGSSMSWLQIMIEAMSGATIDWSESNTDLISELNNLAVASDSNKLKALISTFMMLSTATATAQESASALDSTMKSIASKPGQGNKQQMMQIGQLKSVLNQDNYMKFIENLTKDDYDISSILGEKITTYINEAGEQVDFSHLNMLLNTRFYELSMQSGEQLGRIVSGMSEDFSNLMLGTFSPEDSQVEKWASDIVDKYYAYMRVKAQGRTGADAQDLALLNLDGTNVTEYNTKMQQWSTTFALYAGQMDNTVNALWSAVSQLTGIQTGNYDDLLSYYNGVSAQLNQLGENMQQEYGRGNVDLTHRPQLEIDGGYETVASQSFWLGNKFGEYNNAEDLDLGDFNMVLHATPIVQGENGEWYHMDDDAMNDYIYDILDAASSDGVISYDELLEIDLHGIVRDDGTTIGGLKALLGGEQLEADAAELTDYIYGLLKTQFDQNDYSLANLLALDAEGENLLSDGTYDSMIELILTQQEWSVKLHEAQEEYYNEANAAQGVNGYLQEMIGYLITLIGLQNQMTGDNPFVSLFGRISNDDDVTMVDQMTYLRQMITTLSEGGDEGFANFQNAILSLDSGTLDSLAQSLGLNTQQLIDLTTQSGNASYALALLNAALLNASKKKNGFAEIASNIEAIRRSADAAEAATNRLAAAEAVSSGIQKWKSAVAEYEAATKKMAAGQEVAASEVSTLAEALGATPEGLLNNWAQVPGWMAQYVDQANAEIGRLQTEMFVSVTGITSFDPSNMLNGFMVISEGAEAAAAELAKLGLFKIETQQIDQAVDVLEPDGQGGYNVVRKTMTGTYQVLRPADASPLKTSTDKKRSKGGGGGGGGKNNSGGKTKEQIFVEKANWQLERLKNSATQLNTIMGSWQDGGYFTAMIGGYEQMNQNLAQQDEMLEQYIKQAQEWLPGLYQELAGATEGTEQYDKILERIDTIQDAVVSWTQNLEQNKASIEKNKKAVDDLYDSIRQLQIDLQNEVLKAIQDRENKRKEMLSARIEMENTILDILKNKQQKIENQITQAIQDQIDALNKEKDAIKQIVDQRKEDAETQKELNELAAMQAKYNKISVDPTRSKEAAELWQQILDKQDEIAWKNTDNETDAQQKSIDQQINSLEEYRDYIEQYYEDLLSNPRNFIEQVEDILSMSQQDILAWLTTNSEEYQNATDSTRTQMQEGWSESLNNMYGIVVTYWDEVADIIAHGQDYVIDFLKQNSREYAEASKLQQQAYVDGWQEQFDAIARAYQIMTAQILDQSAFINTTTTQVADDSSSGKKSGGGGGSKKSSGTGIAITQVSDDGIAKTGSQLDTKVAAVAEKLKGGATLGASLAGHFAKGGYVKYTGPAWVDGTPGSPEYMLNPVQTKLMEGLVSALESSVKVPKMPAFDSSGFSTTNNNGYTFNGGITIQVDRLADDADYEQIAEKVKTSIVEAMTRGKSIGF